jgi:hypothetical protein
MSNLFNYYGDSSCNSIVLQPLVESIPSSLVPQSKKSVLVFNSSEPSSLLAKRRQDTELGDLLAKKIKTISTNASDSDSYQSSPTRSPGYESRMPIEGSYQQVQQALELLQQRLLIEQELPLREIPVKLEQTQEPLSIPPFFSIQNARKMEDELEVIFGSVEFPFLSISTPLNNIQNIEKNVTFQFPDSQARNKAMKYSKSKKSSILSSLPSRLASIIDDDRESEASFFTDIRESLTATRTATQQSDFEMEVEPMEIVANKNLRFTEEKKKEYKKKAISRTIEPTKKEEKLPKKSEEKRNKQIQEENIYSLPVSQGRRQKERRLNRWQMAQTDKLSNDGSSSESSAWETNSNGGKKKLVKVPIGSKYQVDVSALPIRNQERKQIKMVWNPLSQNQQVLQTFFGCVRNLLNHNISEEFGIDLLNRNGCDINRALEFVRANRNQCMELLPPKIEY